jgi:hypothetical protein
MRCTPMRHTSVRYAHEAHAHEVRARKGGGLLLKRKMFWVFGQKSVYPTVLVDSVGRNGKVVALI